MKSYDDAELATMNPRDFRSLVRKDEFTGLTTDSLLLNRDNLQLARKSRYGVKYLWIKTRHVVPKTGSFTKTS